MMKQTSEQMKIRQQIAILNRRVGSWRKAREEYIGLWTEEERQAEENLAKEQKEKAERARRQRQRAIDEARMLGIELRKDENAEKSSGGKDMNKSEYSIDRDGNKHTGQELLSREIMFRHPAFHTHHDVLHEAVSAWRNAWWQWCWDRRNERKP